jgi:hypothetical protein
LERLLFIIANEDFKFLTSKMKISKVHLNIPLEYLYISDEFLGYFRNASWSLVFNYSVHCKAQEHMDILYHYYTLSKTSLRVNNTLNTKKTRKAIPVTGLEGT